MIKRKIGWLLQLPMIILMVVAFGAAIYAAKKGLYDISPGASVILGIILVLYFIGLFLVLRSQKEEVNSWENLRKNDLETEEHEELVGAAEEETADEGKVFQKQRVGQTKKIYDENEDGDVKAEREATEETLRGYRRRYYYK